MRTFRTLYELNSALLTLRLSRFRRFLKYSKRLFRLCVTALTFPAIAFLGCVTACSAQDPTPRMEQIIQDYVHEKQFMGSILVAQGGKVLFEKGYGYANLEWDIPNSPTTKFPIASITKQFTAACILLLEERGKLNVNDPVKNYMPDAPLAWDKVTIYNLLTHTSGIPNSFQGLGFREPKTPEQLIGYFRDTPLQFQPGEAARYSNAGYFLLGYLIEKVSGQSYQDFVQENIFRPLSMSDSGYNSNSAILPRRASGYLLTPSGLVNAFYLDMSLPYSAGGLYSTTEDLLRWEQALFGGKLLSAASLKKMITPFMYDYYACGLVVSKIDGRAVIEHSGDGIPGFTSDMVFYPDDKLTIIVLNNFGGETASIVSKLAASVHGEKVILPSERKEITVSPATLAKYAGTYSDVFPGYSLIITVEVDHLMAQLSTGQRAPKVPSSRSQTECSFRETRKVSSGLSGTIRERSNLFYILRAATR